MCKEGCLTGFFEQAIKSQSQYPPKCCGQAIPFEKVEEFLPGDTKTRYRIKTKEYHTDPRFRRYCPSDHSFLNPSMYIDIGESDQTTVTECSTCKKFVCIVCLDFVSEEKDGKHDCKPPPLNELNKNYSPQTRYKACPFCGRLGMLEQACNHVTCQQGCGQEFCFICLEPWADAVAHEGCGHYNDPVYDKDGYSEQGFHRDTGFDREGFTRAGYNIRGLTRAGERVAGFAERKPRTHRSLNVENEWARIEMMFGGGMA